MGDVIRWHRHVNKPCHCCDGPIENWRPSCLRCDGGLFLCAVCGGAEGSLPTDCPGERMPACVEDAVYDGTIDFTARDGWHQTPDPVTRKELR